ncbi:hypothetical protein DV096_13755 [Bradymonadaceae bacterium TMQ3]|uniref:Uncharacterized protein n=1 Tax=Lujinxingia sediminis TaxID=2480984 RepID=A0ABY0CTW0_9DELT|nr:hypothetical protein [Lujinxingia sediminis]RDV37567.1 hypothetical protein DV096_13755 [Bradymonadaceae bacterium TMQ3]RVU45748.1 hypothetical protein EA187_08265 [Lujinxingia sediminis]TXC75120.1 hypothetical protein FRC91_13630 [Bradymonadales bacterium TMQ1]
MAYKAQLVVRASDREGVEVVDGVKAMADRLGKTYSEMALELLRSALGTPASTSAPEPAPAAEAPQKAAEPAEAPAPKASAAPVSKPEKVAKKEPKKESAAPKKSAAKRTSASGVTIDLSKPQSIIETLIAHRDSDGEEAASRVLVDFYAIASPADSFKLKQALQERLGDEAYEALMTPVKETPEYRDYKDRALFGR